ncbi:MAG TPA: GNAT family N-acetyltransferase [Streptosporangiaceae bacterium]|nr:GNAT family N-acetyltransferase [Streptosporangiaceae bacterium]
MTTAVVGADALSGYDPSKAAAWDDLVARSVNGTFQHTRRFLAYHGPRFRDRSLLISDAKGRLAAVLAAAEDPADPSVVVSHPGLTFGGLVRDGSIRGESMVRVFEEIRAWYRSAGFTLLRYKAIPHIYQSAPAGDDLYALFRLGARRHGCDLAAVVNLAGRGRVRADRRRSVARAQALGVRTGTDWQHAPGFWQILAENLAARHGSTPTHSLAEIEYLHDRFGEDIVLVTASLDGTLLGGSLYFAAGPTFHQQYTAVSDGGRAVCATDAVIERALVTASERGCRYVSFGTSTFDQGRRLNESQYSFKASFGAGGVTHEHFELDL